ncbi:dephosphocoenzyme A kinase [Paucilactobacillus vaccinostercus DSM 20634]|jgi:dephospho-CoA kinase|uniref:Dephospho-CoA kinase n=2 Tax=Paucilactobacillus vaccinostercus TaxID=176291 RepID=A0A0R2A512_9LACO|nr:dephosphocoenzyme A kinase [Paucilactobacillus vaccinostercus DSM 20634]
MKMTKVLGLTGGIATGKSTVSRVFEEYHIPIISADEVARQVVEPGSVALNEIQAQFGQVYVNDDGTLNRQLLGTLVFGNSQKLDLLNQIMQPKIRAEIQRQVATLKQRKPKLIVLEIPLLFEQHGNQLVDITMVVKVARQVQLDRLMARNQLSQHEALNRIHSQMSLAEKIKRADVVIDNAGTVEQTREQVVKWLENYKFI